MIEHPFTKKNIQKSIIFSDITKNPLLYNVDYRENLSVDACKQLDIGIFRKNLLITKVIGKPTYQFSSLDQELISRLISKNIKSNYFIRPSNRHHIIKNSISILKEGNPFCLYRCDIVSFFEKIDRKKLLSDLSADGKCSRYTILLIREFFLSLESQGISGLPRGIGLSSVLAEYVLLHFDQTLREQDGFFFYARYVDDILLITSDLCKKTETLKLISSTLPSPLTIHKSGPKVSSLIFSRIISSEKKQLFEYLGYQFEVSSSHHSRDKIFENPRRKVKIDIATSKVKKIKLRLIDSFLEYMKSPTPTAFSILKNRISALSGNFNIEDTHSGIRIRTGIFFNYCYKNEYNQCTLKKLDNFYRGLIFSKSEKLSKKITSIITKSQKEELRGFSFSLGFHQKIFYSFSPKQLKEITKAWKQ